MKRKGGREEEDRGRREKMEGRRRGNREKKEGVSSRVVTKETEREDEVQV